MTLHVLLRHHPSSLPPQAFCDAGEGTEPATGGSSFEVVVAANGRFVAFESSATNLPGDGSQIYVRDLRESKTKLVTRTSGGEVVTGNSNDPSISGDGRSVAFESEPRTFQAGWETRTRSTSATSRRGQTTRQQDLWRRTGYGGRQR